MPRGGKVKHGHARKGHESPMYRVWKNMRRRCNDPSNRAYPNYGGRGIKICERWYVFANFLADMGEPPPECELDRIDNNGDYGPANCRWANRLEQARNKRTNTMITFRGETKCITDWARELGLPRRRIYERLFRQGWSIEDSLTQPIDQHVRLSARHR